MNARLLGAGAIALLAFAPFAQAQQMAKNAVWSLRMPKQDPVAFRGAAGGWAGSAGTFHGPYPAPNAIGLVAAVITHAVIADSAQSKARQEFEEKANRVLVGYKPVIDAFGHTELMEKGLPKVSAAAARKAAAAAEKPGGDWLVDSTPVFLLTQDEQALILDNAIAIFAPGNTEAAVYRNTVRVVSRPQDREDAQAFWTAEQGAALKDESATLLALSLEAALADATTVAQAEAAAHRTFRYQEGKAERMERAQLVSEQCNRLVVRNLRGWLISIPAPQATGSCSGETRKP